MEGAVTNLRISRLAASACFGAEETGEVPKPRVAQTPVLGLRPVASERTIGLSDLSQ